GMPDRKWRSTVRQILPPPETVNDVILYHALIDIANPDKLLMTSITAQVFFLLGEAKNVPHVPESALGPSKTGAEGTYRVQVVTDSGVQTREVRIGLMNRISAQVLSGLEPGERVVTGTMGANASRTSASGGFGGPRGPML